MWSTMDKVKRLNPNTKRMEYQAPYHDDLPALPHYFYIFACLLGVLECSLLLVDRAWLLDVG